MSDPRRPNPEEYILQLEEFNRILQERCDGLRGELEDADALRLFLTAERDRLRDDVQRANALGLVAESQLREAEAERDRLEEECQEANAENVRLWAERDRLRGLVKDWEDQFARGDIVPYQDLAAAEAERDHASAYADKMRAARDALEVECDRLRAENEALQHLYRDMSADDILALRDERDRLREKYDPTEVPFA